jgi:hypothetical protein
MIFQNICCDNFWASVTKIFVSSYFIRWAAGYILRQSPISILTAILELNCVFS